MGFDVLVQLVAAEVLTRSSPRGWRSRAGGKESARRSTSVSASMGRRRGSRAGTASFKILFLSVSADFRKAVRGEARADDASRRRGPREAARGARPRTVLGRVERRRERHRCRSSRRLRGRASWSTPAGELRVDQRLMPLATRLHPFGNGPALRRDPGRACGSCGSAGATEARRPGRDLSDAFVPAVFRRDGRPRQAAGARPTSSARAGVQSATDTALRDRPRPAARGRVRA